MTAKACSSLSAGQRAVLGSRPAVRQNMCNVWNHLLAGTRLRHLSSCHESQAGPRTGMWVILIVHWPLDGLARPPLPLESASRRSRVASAAPAAPRVSTTCCTPACKENQLLSVSSVAMAVSQCPAWLSVCRTRLQNRSPQCSASAARAPCSKGNRRDLYEESSRVCYPPCV
jgi:hypothetical protein